MDDFRHLFALVSLACATALLCASGCAAIQKSQKRTQYIHQKTRNFVYDKKCEQVWVDAREMLFRKGYSVKDTGEGAQMTVETEWKRSDEEYGRTEASRYLVQGTAPEDGKCKVRFTRNIRREDGDLQSERDLDMEWTLLQRAAPERAQEIQANAQATAEAATN